MAIIAAAEQLVRDGGEDYERLAARYAPLGYRGHPITKTRRYSPTFKALRNVSLDPWRIGRIVAAALVLLHFDHARTT